nr:ATP-dependent Clp protease proteolytic subunit [Berberis fortunei]
MPVGVPKVPFRIPGDEDATWVDLINRLHRERLLFLGDSIEDELANQVMGLMLFLNIEDKDLEQWLFINSPGGWIVPGVGIYDMMQLVIPDVNTVCMGVAASMASFVLVGGEITKRLAFLRARVMMHQPAGTFFQQEIPGYTLESRAISEFRDRIVKIYSVRTQQPHWVIAADLERDTFMDASEAKEYGIIDLIAESVLNTG